MFSGILKKDAQTIYFGGDIITMEGDKAEYAEAVVQEKGKMFSFGGGVRYYGRT